MVSDLTKYTINGANYAACYSSKQDTESLSGWNGLFYSFLRCEENGTGLVRQEAAAAGRFGGQVPFGARPSSGEVAARVRVKRIPHGAEDITSGTGHLGKARRYSQREIR